jgi:chromosome segregation ATPase
VALKTAGEAGSKAQALTSELERSKEAIRTITAQLDKAEKDRDAAKRAADARFDALEADQAARATESRTLNSKLAADEAALKAAGDSGAKAQALAAEFEQAKDDANSVRTHLAQAQRAADAAKGDLASKDAALESAQKDLLASRTELTRAQKERDATKADADSRIAELEATQSARAADAKTLASKLASDEAALKAAGDSGTKTQAAAAQLARAQDDLASTRAQLTQAEKERDGAKSDAATRIAALEADQAARANDAKALATKEASDEAALKAAGDAGTRAQALAGELETTRGDLQTARAQLAQARKDAEGAKAAVPQVAGLQQQNTRLTADKAALEDKLARAVEEANAARAAAARAAGEAGGKAQALAGELSRTKNNLEAARTELVQVRKDETAAKAGPAAQVATLQASAAHLTDENADLRDRLAKAEEAAKSARTTVAGSADLSARVQALEAEIGKNDHDIDVAHYLLTHALRNAAEAKATYESQDSARNAELASLRQEVAAATAAAERATRGAAAPDASASNSRALTDALQRAQNDLLTTRAQLAETQRNEESSRAEAGSASAERSALERQVADLTERLAAANRITSVALDDGGRLRRPTAPQRPYASVSAIPSGTTAAASSAPAPEQRTHTVVEGDTLTKISLEYYGTARRWQSIFQANRDVVSNEEILSIGTVLRIP